MIEKKVKHMAKDAMVIGVTGIGLGVGASAMGAAGAGAGSIAAVGKFGSGLGKVGGIVAAGHVVNILGSTTKKISKKMRY